MHKSHSLALARAQLLERFGEARLYQRDPVARGFRKNRSGPAK